MNILRSGNKMSVELQKGLADFNIMRDQAIEGSKDIKGDGPKYFGLSQRKKQNGDLEMFFPKDDITDLDNQYGMSMAVVVPAGTQTFDLMEPKFGAKLNMREPKSVRAYLRKLLESI